MISARLAALAGTVILPLAFGPSTAPAGDPGRIEARFEIFGLAGLHVLTTRTIVTQGPNWYAITMDKYIFIIFGEIVLSHRYYFVSPFREHRPARATGVVGHDDGLCQRVCARSQDREPAGAVS